MIGNDEGKFCPTNNITRAESLVTLNRAILDIFDYIYGNYALLSDLSIEGATLEHINRIIYIKGIYIMLFYN